MVDKQTKQRVDTLRTCTKILKAGQKLFANHGFAGTSMSMLAKKAGVNQSLIHHHFKDKQNLWKAVKLDILGSIACTSEEDRKKIANSTSFESFVRSYSHFKFNLYDKNENLRRMIKWQSLEGTTRELRGISPKVFENFCECVKRFQEAGEVDIKYSPEQILMLINGASISFFESAHFLSVKEAKSVTIKEQYLEMVIQCLWKGLQG